MKKTYIAPKMEVVKMEMCQMIALVKSLNTNVENLHWEKGGLDEDDR